MKLLQPFDINHLTQIIVLVLLVITAIVNIILVKNYEEHKWWVLLAACLGNLWPSPTNIAMLMQKSPPTPALAT